MTTSSLYHTQGIRGYQYQKTERAGDTETYYIHSTAQQINCPSCRSADTSLVHTGKTRDIRGLNIGFKKRFSVEEYGVFFVKAVSPPPKSLFFFARHLMCAIVNILRNMFWLYVKPCPFVMSLALRSCIGKALRTSRRLGLRRSIKK